MAIRTLATERPIPVSEYSEGSEVRFDRMIAAITATGYPLFTAERDMIVDSIRISATSVDTDGTPNAAYVQFRSLNDGEAPTGAVGASAVGRFLNDVENALSVSGNGSPDAITPNTVYDIALTDVIGETDTDGEFTRFMSAGDRLGICFTDIADPTGSASLIAPGTLVNVLIEVRGRYTQV